MKCSLILIELDLSSLLIYLWPQFLNLSFSFGLTTDQRIVLHYKKKTSHADSAKSVDILQQVADKVDIANQFAKLYYVSIIILQL